MSLGLVTRQERWGLTLRGWLLVLGLALALGFALVRGVHPFLAPTFRTPSEYLIVEGWIPDSAIHAAADEFRRGAYRLAISTGGPASRGNTHLSGTHTASELGANRLRRAGVPPDSVRHATAPVVTRDRTYHAALALRDWFRAERIPVRQLNIVTEDVHARRTRLLYQLAFGPEVTVGVIAVPNPDYDGARWWHNSAGVKDVVGESIAYLYAKFFFHPAPAPASTTAS